MDVGYPEFSPLNNKEYGLKTNLRTRQEMKKQEDDSKLLPVQVCEIDDYQIPTYRRINQEFQVKKLDSGILKFY